MEPYPVATALLNLCANDDLAGADHLAQAYIEEGGTPPELVFGLVKAAMAVHYWTHTSLTGQPPTTQDGRQLFQALAHTSAFQAD